MTPMSTNTIDHPVRSGPRGTAWYVAGHLTIICSNVLTVALLAVVMLTSGNLTQLAFGVLGVMAAVALVRPRIFRAAWSEVPGAFGYRSTTRGDVFERRHLVGADYAWKAVHAAVMIAGAVLLVHLDQVEPAVRAFTVGGFGGLGLGIFTALAIGGLLVEPWEQWVDRLRIAPVLTFAAWVAIATTQAGAPSWATDVAQLGVTMGLVGTLMVALFTAMLHTLRGH